MKPPSKPNELSAIDAIKKIHSGALTSVDLVKACLARINEREAEVAAWQYLPQLNAINTAAQSDKTSENTMLKGIPIGIKDIFDTADMPTEYGSSIYKGHIPKADASSVARIKEAGGLILGKTVTTEFAYFKPGKTKNPCNVKHTPGGSSSGSAAAVADFMVPLALGSQTVGSTIRPASYCGVIGYKPSFGLIDRTGVRTLADTFDTIGIFSRTVEDAAYFAGILSRRPSLTLAETALKPLKFAICRTAEWHAADQDSQTAFDTATRLIDRAGAEIEEISLPEIFENFNDAQGLITDYEAANSAAHELRSHQGAISNYYIEKSDLGLSYSEEQYDQALLTISEAQSRYKVIIKGVDAILCPSATGEAPIGHDSTGDPVLNRMGTGLKVPCINVPGLTGRSGLPIGVQLIGGFKEDTKTLNAAGWLHKVLLEG